MCADLQIYLNQGYVHYIIRNIYICEIFVHSFFLLITLSHSAPRAAKCDNIIYEKNYMCKKMIFIPRAQHLYIWKLYIISTNYILNIVKLHTGNSIWVPSPAYGSLLIRLVARRIGNGWCYFVDHNTLCMAE